MWFILLAALATTAFAGAPLDPDCTVADSAGALTVAPEGIACTDVMAAPTCTAIFAETPADAANRPTQCENVDLKKLAIEQCPKYCGFCCKTPPYNCPNKAYSQTGLNCTNMADKCKDATWRPLIAENCPSICGMCLEGGCVDKAPDCASQQTICFNTNFQAWAKENCARTCNQCPPAGATTAGAAATTAAPGAGPAPATTAAPANPPAACVDIDVNCVNWKNNGKFCGNTWYQAQWYKCKKSCGLC